MNGQPITHKAGIFHSGPGDGLCLCWHAGSHTCSELTVKHWSYSHPSRPPPLLLPFSPILSLSLTCGRMQCRQVGLIGCIGQRQSCTPSCGNRSLMISILHLCRIYLSCRDSGRHLFFSQLHQIMTRIIHIICEPCTMKGSHFTPPETVSLVEYRWSRH